MNKGIIVAGLLALALAAQSAGAKTLEEVLKEKGVITEADYYEIQKEKPKTPPVSVSYTHLTLPTKRIV